MGEVGSAHPTSSNGYDRVQHGYKEKYLCYKVLLQLALPNAAYQGSP